MATEVAENPETVSPEVAKSPDRASRLESTFTKSDALKARQRHAMLAGSIADELDHRLSITGNPEARDRARKIGAELTLAASQGAENLQQVLKANGIATPRQLINTVWLATTGSLANSKANGHAVDAEFRQIFKGAEDPLGKLISAERRGFGLNRIDWGSEVSIKNPTESKAESPVPPKTEPKLKESEKPKEDSGTLTNSFVFDSYFKKAGEIGAVNTQQRYKLAYALAMQDGFDLQRVVDARNRNKQSVFAPADCAISASRQEEGRGLVEKIKARLDGQDTPTINRKNSEVSRDHSPETSIKTVSTVPWDQWTKISDQKYDFNNHLKTSPDLVNRTFPGRFDDHISFLKKLGIVEEKAYFIDIGPGVGDHHDANKRVQRDNPAITSLEMAKAFPGMQVVALDLKEHSIDVLKDARLKDPKIGEALLSQPNVSILAGDGLKSLRSQIESSGDAFSNKKIAAVGKDQTVIIRACNSIDIYCDWKKEVLPALRNMAADFKDNPAVLLFNDRILFKPQGSDDWIPAGNVSKRGFNHNQQTVAHVKRGTPEFTLLPSITLDELRKNLIR